MAGSAHAVSAATVARLTSVHQPTERTLILLRHGESTANAQGLFTGVLDAPLTPRGIVEARRAAEQIARARLHPGVVLTSELRRATQTAWIVADRLARGRETPQVRRDWRLNERSYGALTGMSKAQVLHRFGHDRFVWWRRSMDGRPAPMPEPQWSELAARAPFDRLPARALPRTESLRDVIARVRPMLAEVLSPLLQDAGSVACVAHGNSLRALCACLDHLDDAEVAALNIPNAYPLVYRLDARLHPLRRGGRYLDEAAARAAARRVAREGGT